MGKKSVLIILRFNTLFVPGKKSPTFGNKSLTFWKKIPDFWEKIPDFWEKNHCLLGKNP